MFLVDQARYDVRIRTKDGVPMAHTLQFQVGAFELDVDNDCYLVSVRPTNNSRNRQSRSHDIPAWVFHSKHAIWLMDDGTSIMERATKGERIKKQLLALG